MPSQTEKAYAELLAHNAQTKRALAEKSVEPGRTTKLADKIRPITEALAELRSYQATAVLSGIEVDVASDKLVPCPIFKSLADVMTNISDEQIIRLDVQHDKITVVLTDENNSADGPVNEFVISIDKDILTEQAVVNALYECIDDFEIKSNY